jgi:hypothetical protein
MNENNMIDLFTCIKEDIESIMPLNVQKCLQHIIRGTYFKPIRIYNDIINNKVSVGFSKKEYIVIHNDIVYQVNQSFIVEQLELIALLVYI